MFCGVRSLRSNAMITGKATTTRAAAAISQVMRQPKAALSTTKLIGRVASAAGKPRPAMEIALPRCASNQRPTAVMDVLDIIP